MRMILIMRIAEISYSVKFKELGTSLFYIFRTVTFGIVFLIFLLDKTNSRVKLSKVNNYVKIVRIRDYSTFLFQKK
jgi:hypothetical protein